MPFYLQSQPSKDGEEVAKVGKWGEERKGSARGTERARAVSRRRYHINKLLAAFFTDDESRFFLLFR